MRVRGMRGDRGSGAVEYGLIAVSVAGLMVGGIALQQAAATVFTSTADRMAESSVHPDGRTP